MLYALFHSTDLRRLDQSIDDSSGIADLTATTGASPCDALQDVESTGLTPSHFASALQPYLSPAQEASARGLSVAFLAASLIALIGLAAMTFLVRRPSTVARPDTALAGFSGVSS